MLNVYWFYGILKGVNRVLKSGVKEAKSGSRDAELT